MSRSAASSPHTGGIVQSDEWVPCRGQGCSRPERRHQLEPLPRLYHDRTWKRCSESIMDLMLSDVLNLNGSNPKHFHISAHSFLTIVVFLVHHYFPVLTHCSLFSIESPSISSLFLSSLLSVPGLSWLLILLYLPDAQKWYQRPFGTPCPPGTPGVGLPLSPTAPGYISSHPVLRLPDKGHQGGAVASLTETGRCAKLPQLKPRPPTCSSDESSHWPCLLTSPDLTMLPMEVPDGVQQRNVLLDWRREEAHF